MGEFSLPHLLIVGMIILIFFGPNRLPALGQSLGKAIKGFKDGLNVDESNPGAGRGSTPPSDRNLAPGAPRPDANQNAVAASATEPKPSASADPTDPQRELTPDAHGRRDRS